MVFQEHSNNEIDDLIKLATTPTTKKELQSLEKKSLEEIVGIFYKEKNFKPYRYKPTHSALIYIEFKRWYQDKQITYKQFIKAFSVWFAPIKIDDEVYFYTRFRGLRNIQAHIRKCKNEIKKENNKKKSK